MKNLFKILFLFLFVFSCTSTNFYNGNIIKEVEERYDSGEDRVVKYYKEIEGKKQLYKVAMAQSNKMSYNIKPNINELHWSNPTIWELVLDEELRFYPNLQHYKSELEFGKDDVNSLPYLKIIHPMPLCKGISVCLLS